MFFHFIIAAPFVATIVVASDGNCSHNQKRRERGLARLLGREGAETFLDTVWGGDWYYFLPASPSFDSTDLLWSLGLSEYYLQNDGGKPWAFEEDIKIVKDGQVYYESRQPATWKDVQTNLKEGATIAMHDLQKRHEPIRALCAELEDEMEIFVNANSYLTPAGSTGFDPHYDWHDILVLQMEGSKTWTICEQRDVDFYEYRNGGGKRIFQHGEDFGNCTELLFGPGDLFYAPFGTIHYAKANTHDDKNNANLENHSMHLTLSMARQQYTWGQFLQDILESKEDRFSAQFSAIVARSKRLQTQIPISALHDIGYSIDNSDLPPGFLEQFRRQVTSIVKDELSSHEQLRTHVLMLLDNSNDALDDTVDLYRYKTVMGRLKESRDCPPSNNIDIDTTSFRRVSRQRMMLAEVEDYGAIVVTGTTEEEQIVFPLRWKYGLRFALGLRGAGMKLFTAEDLVVKAKMKRENAMKMIKKLIDACLLEWKVSQITSMSEQESCAA